MLTVDIDNYSMKIEELQTFLNKICITYKLQYPMFEEINNYSNNLVGSLIGIENKIQWLFEKKEYIDILDFGNLQSARWLLDEIEDFCIDFFMI